MFIGEKLPLVAKEGSSRRLLYVGAVSSEIK